MKLIIRSLLALTLALSSGCAMSSTYKHYNASKPAAMQTKARSLGILQIRAAGDGQAQEVMAGVDWMKVNPTFFEVLSEDPIGTTKAISWDAIKVGGVAALGKWINDKYNLTGGGGDKNEDNPNVINASNGGNIEVNGAPSDSYKGHSLNADGSGSSIRLNYDSNNEEKNDNAPFNNDNTPNLDGNI